MLIMLFGVVVFAIAGFFLLMMHPMLGTKPQLSDFLKHPRTIIGFMCILLSALCLIGIDSMLPF